MPIHWRDNQGKTWETHHGLVVGSETRCVRVMSDVYSDENYATVFNPVDGKFESLHIGGAFELNAKSGTAIRDIGPEIEAIITENNRKAAIEQRSRLIADAIERAKTDVLAPRKGRTVRVVGGRKVPKGTIGKVFWVDAYEPTRVGIKDAADNTHWVNAAYCVAIYPEFAYGSEPPCGWLAYRQWQEAAAVAVVPTIPKGAVVTLTHGKTGTVFWTKDHRIGVRHSENKDENGNWADVTWTEVTEVTVLNGVTVIKTPVVNPPLPVPLPFPYSEIAWIEGSGDVYRARTVKGEVVMELDPEGVSGIKAAMPYLSVETVA